MDTGWFKSSYSNGGGDECVECRMISGAPVQVRDSKNTDGSVLRLPSAAWSAFTESV